jgi:hypothetical protein
VQRQSMPDLQHDSVMMAREKAEVGPAENSANGEKSWGIRSHRRAGVLEAQRGFRKLAGYRALPALVAALRAHDAQLDRTEGKLDTARNAA